MYHYHLDSLDETKQLSQKIANRLEKGGVLLLYGELGTGKTTLTQMFASCLDIKEKIKSPTYTLMQKYKLKDGRSFYHLDLYRLTDIDEILGIGYEEIIADMKNIIVIEWADRIGNQDKPKNRLDVFLNVHGENQRDVELSIVRENRMREEDIQALLNEFQTPQNVRRHCEMVTQVALELGTKLVEKGEIISLGFLYEAAMLHDLVRLIDFNELKKENFSEEISDEKWALWQKLRKKYKGQHHAKVAQEILIKHGRPEIAEIIRKHCTSCILSKSREEELITWEDKLLYYADKRVKHTNIVSVQERFKMGREQNPHLIESEKESQEIQKKVLALEKEIFDIIEEDPVTYEFFD